MRLATFPRPVLRAAALLLALTMALYGGLWMYYVRQKPQTRLGVDGRFEERERAFIITKVHGGSAADRGGLRTGDRIVSIAGRALDTMDPFYDLLWKAPPGTLVALDVGRAGASASVRVELRPDPLPMEPRSIAQRIASELIESFPVPFLAVGLIVLFLRLEDRNAWLLALLFASFIAVAPVLGLEPILHPRIRGFVLAYKVLFHGLIAALFYYFFSVFPVSSPLDQRLPWLKRAMLGGTSAIVLPVSLWVLVAGRSRPLNDIASRIGASRLSLVLSAYLFGATVLGLVSLVWNAVRAPSAEARRRIRVILWGTIIGVVPFLLIVAAAVYAGKDPYEFPFWVWAPCVIASCLFPLSFGYAVVMHRVLEIPVLLRRSARYLLVQRSVFVFWVFLGTPILSYSFARGFSRLSATHAEVSVGLGMLFGVILTLVSIVGGRQFNERLDRAFFRSAYDARRILEDLAQKTRTATSRQQLAELMEIHLKEALHPRHLAIYLESTDGNLHAARGRVPIGMETLDAATPLFVDLAARGQPWEVPPLEARAASGLSALEPLEADCLVPLVGRDGRLGGLLVLGPRLSEEPYSGMDKRLLASIASQAGVALENMRLADAITQRLEAERRIELEMEIAKQVQQKLLPQITLPLRTLEYAADCVQARAVGGDFYDFLDLGPGRAALVLADISGKSISAALRMASLQASLRSRSALALHDLPGLLGSVNRQMLASSEPQHYATLFFGVYDDETRELRYVNCGHNPPLLLRANGNVERLDATATVLGALAEWTCTVEGKEIEPEDTLVLYTDGVVEATRVEEQFGEARLLETLRDHRHDSPRALLERIVCAVRAFAPGEQSDDMTLVLARGR